jgi:SSS family transporter
MKLRFAILAAVFAVLSLAADDFQFQRREGSAPPCRPGCFAGQSNGRLLIGGGLNDNGEPSDSIFVQTSPNTWREFHIKIPVAYSAAVSTDSTLILAGGLGIDGPVSSVQVLEFKDDGISQTELPALPKPLMMAGAGMFSDQPQKQIYVAGGSSAKDPSTASAALFRLTLNVPGSSWEDLPPMPGGPRLLPAVACLYNDVLIFGGLLDGHTLARAEAFRWKRVDGTTFTGWRTLPSMPSALAAPAVFQTGQVHVAVAGGELDAHGAPSPDIFVYHDVTETWIRKGRLPSPLVQPFAVKRNDGWTLLGSAGQFDVTLNRTARNLSPLDYLALFGYFAIVTTAGIWYSRKQKSSQAFALGDRKIPWWMAGISMFATGASSISFMAIPAQSFRTSLLWSYPFLALIPLWFLEAYVLYPLVRRLRITSTFEYLERRFHPSLRYIASAQAMTFQVFGKMNMVMLLPALAIHAVTGMNVFRCVLLIGLVTTAYTVKGGIKAVILTEVIQGITMIAGVSMIFWLAVSAVPGGFDGFVATASQFDRFRPAIWSWDYTMPVFWILVLTPIINKLAIAADPPIIQRVFASPLRDVRKVAAMYVFCGVVISFAVTLAGVAVFTYFHAHPDKLDIAMTNDQVIPLYIVQRLPVGIAGLIIASLFSAAASALAGNMNSVAILFTEDFYRKLKKSASDREQLITMKFASAVAGILATGCALYMAGLNERSLFQTWNEIIALLGGGFLGMYILGTFTRRANSVGAFTGAIFSIAATVLVKKYTSVHWYAYLPIAVATCITVGYLLSLVTPKEHKDLTGLTAFDVRRDLVEDELAAAHR